MHNPAEATQTIEAFHVQDKVDLGVGGEFTQPPRVCISR